MSVREHDFNREIVNMFNQIRYEWRTNPIILGGSSGSEGGSTGAPGGVVGQVGQRNVTGDTSEGSFLVSSGSIGSLLDNLKRIRYWELPSRQFGLEENVPADTTWSVSSGSWYYADVTNPLIYLGGQTPPITLPSSGSRLDILTISSSGILQWLSGTSGSAPTMPTVPSVSSGSMPIFSVVIRSSGSACRNYDNGETSHYIFRDMRPFLDWGIGGAGGSSGSFVPGSIPFGSGSGVLTEENQYLYWDTVYKRLLRGTNTFGAYDSIFAFPGIYNVNQNNDGSGFVPVAFGAGSPGITGIKINGTIASPTGALDGNVLVRMSGRGWGATAIGSASRSRLEAVAVGNWTDSEQGSKWDFYTTGSATTTVTKAVTITDQQELQVHALNTGGRLLQTNSSGIVSESSLQKTGTGLLQITTSAPGSIISAPTSGGIALGAETVSISSLNASSGPNHTHAITSSSNPGASASILATNSSGSISVQVISSRFGLLPSAFLGLPELRGLWMMSSVDESGNVIDLSGQGRTLTNNNSATRAVYEDSIPYVNLDGSNQSLSRVDEPGLSVTGALTFIGWFKFDALTTTRLLASKWNDTGDQRSWQMWYNSSTGFQAASVSGDGSAGTTISVNNTITLSTGTWYMFTMRYTPSTELAIFTNANKAVKTTSVPASLFGSNQILSIGTRGSLDLYFDGQVGVCALCASAIPERMITDLFAITRTPFGV